MKLHTLVFSGIFAIAPALMVGCSDDSDDKAATPAAVGGGEGEGEGATSSGEGEGATSTGEGEGATAEACTPATEQPAANAAGACLNAWDGAILASIDATAESTSCGLPCIGRDDAAECAGACLQEKTCLSDDCSGCFVGIFQCIVDNCLASGCAVDAAGDACMACRADNNCDTDFTACAGDLSAGAGEGEGEGEGAAAGEGEGEGEGAAAAPDADSCAAALGCALACADDTCIGICVAGGDLDAQTLAGALLACAAGAGCVAGTPEFVGCVAGACQTELGDCQADLTGSAAAAGEGEGEGAAAGEGEGAAAGEGEGAAAGEGEGEGGGQ